MNWYQWILAIVVVGFVIPFFMYLFSRLQMTAWMNALDDWLLKKATEEKEKMHNGKEEN